MSAHDRDAVKQHYLESNDTIEMVAAKFGISDRTIYRWSNEDPAGKWPDLRKARKIVSPNFGASNHSHGAVPSHPPVRPRRSKGAIDDLEIVELAISDISARMGSDSMDARGLGSCASALVRLIELRRKISPPTAADLAEAVIALGLSPSEFVAELKKRWQESA